VVAAIHFAMAYRTDVIARGEPAFNIVMIILFAPQQSGDGPALDFFPFGVGNAFEHFFVESISFFLALGEYVFKARLKRGIGSLVGQPEVNGLGSIAFNTPLIYGRKFGA